MVAVVKAFLDTGLSVTCSIGCPCIFTSSGPGRDSSIAGGPSTAGVTEHSLGLISPVGVVFVTVTCKNYLSP